MTREVTVVIKATDSFSAVVNKYQREMGQAEQATKRASDSASVFGRTLQTALAAVSIQQVTQFAEGFNTLGRNVIQAEAVFARLNGGLVESERLLTRLQSATGGVIDDLSLMNGANRLMSMGLAETQGEVARLTELAVKLGGAMGNDAASSIENFSLLLANESILRLDTFGISAARVRERIDELLASGEALNRSEAFRLAVLEVGGDSLERLGDAANVGETALARLQTRLNNMWQQGAENFAVGLEAIVNLLGAIETSSTDRKVQALIDGAMQDPSLRPQLEAYAYGQAFGSIGNARQEAIARAQAQQRAVWEARTAYSNAQTQYIDPMGRELFGGLIDTGLSGFISSANQFMPDGFPEFITPAQSARLQDAAAAMDALYESALAAHETGIIADDQLAKAESTRDTMNQIADAAERAANAFEDLSLAQAFGQGVRNPLIGDLTGGALGALRDSGLFTDEQLQQFQDALDLNSGAQTDVSLMYRDDILPMLADIAAQFGDGALVTALNNLETEIRDAALEGRTPNLLDATGYGYTPGGMGGFTVRPGDTPSGIAAASGLSIEQVMAIAGITDPRRLQPGSYGGGMGGGRLVPTRGVHPDFGGTSGAVDETTPEQAILADVESINVEVAAIQEQSAKWEASMKQIASDSEITAGYMPDAAKDAGLLSGHMKEVEDKSRKTRDFITEISSKVNVVRVRLDVSDPKNLLGLFNSNPSLFETVMDNGGIVPGTK